MAEKIDWKGRAKRAAARLRSGGGKVAAGAKGSAMSIASGAGIFELDFRGLSKVEALNNPDRWWLKPVLLGIAGHFVKRKSGTIGTAMLAISGYTAAQAFENRPQSSSTEGVNNRLSDAGAHGQLSDSVYARRMGQGNGYGGAYAGGGPVAEAAAAQDNSWADAGAMSGSIHGWNQQGG